MTAHLHSTGIIPLPRFSRVLDPEASPISLEYLGIAHTHTHTLCALAHSCAVTSPFSVAAQLLGEVTECHECGRAWHGDCSSISTLCPGILSIKNLG